MPESIARRPFGLGSDDIVLLDQIRALVADAADCPVADVGPDDDLYTVLGIDSLGAISIFVDLAFHYQAPEPKEPSEFQVLNTSRKLLAYVRHSPSFEASAPGSLSRELPATKEVAHLLPYGELFRFVETIHAHERGRIVTRMHWPAENALLQAHFPAGPRILPGALLGEQFTQSALLLGILEGRVDPREPLLVTRLKSVFLAPARVPAVTECTVVFRAEVRGQMGFAGSCQVSATEIARFDGLAARIPL